jgi:EmrB/QacA subfamily drug resistance transporter
VTEKRRLLFVLIATIIGSAIVLLDGTIVNLALPKIAKELHVSFSGLQWIVDGYMLSLSSLILLGGSLGDIFGRKRVYFIGLIGFGLSSLACALAPDAIALVVGRVVQGIFGALLVPGGLSLINTNFSRADRGQAIGRWTAWTSIAIVIAPLVGGSILNVASWRWIFLVNIPLIILCLIFGVPSIKESKSVRTRHIDVRGSIAAAVALAGFTLGLIEGPATHWQPWTIAGLLLGLLATVGFVAIERHETEPMVDLSLFASRNFADSNLMTFCMYGALSGFTVALVIYLQQVIGYSSLKTGLTTLPISILMFFFAGRIGKLSGRYGPRRFMTVGPVFMGIGMALLFFLKPGDSYVLHILPGVLLFGIGLVATVAPLTTTVMTSVDEDESGIASGVNNAVSRAAGLIVVAILGLLGAAHVFHFAIILCASMAILAGIISFVWIEPFTLMKSGKD